MNKHNGRVSALCLTIFVLDTQLLNKTIIYYFKSLFVNEYYAMALVGLLEY